MSRTKEIYPNEVPHLWANAENPNAPQSARNGSRFRANLHFSGATIYSYSTPVATRVTLGTGKRARHITLISEHRYSVTTAKHLSDIRSAARHHPAVFLVRDIGVYGGQAYRGAGDFHSTNRDYFRKVIDGYVAAAKTSRLHRDGLLQDAARMVQTARDYCEAFGQPVRPFPLKEAAKYQTLSDDARELMAARRATQEARRSARWAARRERERLAWAAYEAAAPERAAAEKLRREAYDLERNKTPAQRRADWLNGLPYSSAGIDGPTLLRLAERPGETRTVETSRGASVPYEAACLLYLALRRGVDVRGQQIGSYIVKGYEGDGEPRLIIGCHELHYTEIERFARLQGWAMLPNVSDYPVLATPAEYPAPDATEGSAD